MVDTSQISLALVIGWVETKNCPHALRFEPTVYQNLITGSILPGHMVILQRIIAIHKCSLGTAEMIYSTSFGKYQTMGFNLYVTEGTDQDIITFCSDEAEQDRIFTNFVNYAYINYSVSELASDPLSRSHFADRYNGSETYAASIVDSLKNFGLTVSA